MMSMQKEEKIAVVMALGSLSVAFWAFYPDEAAANSAATLERDGGHLEEGLVLGIKPTNSSANLLLSLDTTLMPISFPPPQARKRLRAESMLATGFVSKGSYRFSREKRN
jgi:hypothetical protein